MPVSGTNNRRAVRITVRGRVQGVGFRPFVHRLATTIGVAGWVRNDVEGVSILVEATGPVLDRFQAELTDRHPAIARIESMECETVAPTGATGFHILPGDAQGHGVARVPLERVVCEDCLAEIRDPANRRHRHPFANCTACGPRYTILEGMPYDRAGTTMAGFAVCEACKSEYMEPRDRRFHAQPIACPRCGPQLTLKDMAGNVLAAGNDAITRAAGELRDGRILALKGLGGFQLLVRADDPAAVRRLRDRKRRPVKPLAVMARLTEIERFAWIDPAERAALSSPENPIVLLRQRGDSPLAPEIALRCPTVGFLLPTTPLHSLLVDQLGFPLVATSGNRSDEPTAIDDAAALEQLAGVAELLLTHDRPIKRRADDSVVRVIAGRPTSIRLARGYAPLPLPHLERWAKGRVPGGVLAVGGQQKNAIALWTGTQAILGPHIGDLDDPTTEAAFHHMISDMSSLYHCKVSRIACDRHPDYAATRWAEDTGLPLLRLQHHHAHAAAVIAEHGLFDREVLAFIWDGTGLGDDGILRGGEAMLTTPCKYERITSLRPFALPGGEAAVRQPARVAFILAVEALGLETVLQDRKLLDRLGLDASAACTLATMAARGIHSPLSTGMGRLFDGIAALLEPVGCVSYEGEAAVWLESMCMDAPADPYPMPADGDWRPMVRAVLDGIAEGDSVRVIATRFHHTLAAWAVRVAEGFPKVEVVLGGGCFQNRLLSDCVRGRLERAGHTVHQGELVPANDGGLAAGQLAVALAMLNGGG